MANVTKKPLYKVVDGVRIPENFSTQYFKEALQYKAQLGDIFIVTYPKCGTTWMQNIAIHIFSKGQPLADIKDFAVASPFIEMLGSQGVAMMPRPGAIKTHLAYQHIPYSPEAKYIYIVRNPKDCCVSLYHHTKNPRFGFEDGEFDDFYELFMIGEVEFDDYFDHLNSWYPHRNDPNVFFTTYEDMKKNTKEIVIRLANFLGKEYGEMVEKETEILNNILHYSSFTYMKENLNKFFELSPEEIINDPSLPDGLKHWRSFSGPTKSSASKSKVQFVRKGETGDWKNLLSDDQSHRLTAKFYEKTKGTDIVNWWKEYL